jgi:hypothetical protein
MFFSIIVFIGENVSMFRPSPSGGNQLARWGNKRFYRHASIDMIAGPYVVLEDMIYEPWAIHPVSLKAQIRPFWPLTKHGNMRSA